MLPPLRHGPWNLTDLRTDDVHASKVFSIFHCGGGSTMGYKLAGYNVLGGVEIDAKMMQVYRANHYPEHSYLMSVQEFNKLQSVPVQISSLDILDGSPPCSTFSAAGLREKAWGKLKMFREGQSVQILDDLFGHFLVTVNKLRPKVVIAENVKGMLFGSAKGYVYEINKTFQSMGYSVQLFLLNASIMGVPQRRERVFFVANRLGRKLNLSFNENPVSLHHAISGVRPHAPKMMTSRYRRLNWNKAAVGERFGAGASQAIRHFTRCDPRMPAYTLTAEPGLYHWSECRLLQGLEVNRVQTFPDDFNFCGQNPTYLCGMSVPPYMMQRIARQVYLQLLAPSGSGTAEAADA